MAPRLWVAVLWNTTCEPSKVVCVARDKATALRRGMAGEFAFNLVESAECAERNDPSWAKYAALHDELPSVEDAKLVAFFQEKWQAAVEDVHESSDAWMLCVRAVKDEL